MERRIVIAISLLNDLFEEVTGCDLEELGALDREVLIDQADCAGRHATNILFLHQPLLRRATPELRAATIDRLFLRYPYEMDCRCESEEEHIIAIAKRAYDELIELTKARKRTIAREADFALSHLDVLLLLLDPEMYARVMEEASADDRVRIAAQAEQVELMLEESREITREDTFYTP